MTSPESRSGLSGGAGSVSLLSSSQTIDDLGVPGAGLLGPVPSLVSSRSYDNYNDHDDDNDDDNDEGVLVVVVVVSGGGDSIAPCPGSVSGIWVSCDRTAVQLTGPRNTPVSPGPQNTISSAPGTPGPSSGVQFTVVGVRYLSCVIVLPRRRSVSTDHCQGCGGE